MIVNLNLTVDLRETNNGYSCALIFQNEDFSISTGSETRGKIAIVDLDKLGIRVIGDEKFYKFVINSYQLEKFLDKIIKIVLSNTTYETFKNVMEASYREGIVDGKREFARQARELFQV